MGHATTIFGCIECQLDHADKNQHVLDQFQFDDVYPFRNCFGKFIQCYCYASVGFAQTMKGDSNAEWSEWLLRFDELLERLDFVSASVLFDGETRSNRCCLSFVRVENRIERFRSLVPGAQAVSDSDLSAIPY